MSATSTGRKLKNVKYIHRQEAKNVKYIHSLKELENVKYVHRQEARKRQIRPQTGS